jgi:L-ribulokinase
MGSSVCNLVMTDTPHEVVGIGGIVRDGNRPGLWAYDAGQSGVGDMFGWFVRHHTPASYQQAAPHGDTIAYLEALAAAQQPDECGLIALDRAQRTWR